MNLLMVSAYLPGPKSGASIRTYQLLKALAQRHNVTVLALSDVPLADISTEMALLEGLARRVQIIPYQKPRSRRWQQIASLAQGRSHLLHMYILPGAQDMLDILLVQEQIDAVLFESVLLAGYHLPEGLITIIDQHNIEYEILQRTYEQEPVSLRKWYNWQECHLLKQTEIERCRKADLILVTSQRERSALQRFLPAQGIEVVPNGVDLDALGQPNSKQESPHQIVFIGTMDYYPNAQAALFFARQCWPHVRARIPDATWQIVGGNPPPEIQKLARLPGVTVTGRVPDVRPYLAASALAIAPLQIGSGTRLKVLEALAMQKAVVSTSLGCEGLAVEPGKHLLVADRPAAFVEAVVTLMQRPEQRAALGIAGRSLVEAEYSWRRCSNHLLSVLETACAEKAEERV